ncbi:MAG: protease modulator HflC [Nitrospinae bacterium]|nr:protease modulator HflC [Nitrospinota bacterium]
MKKAAQILVPVAALVILLVGQDAFFIVRENSQAVVTQFGRFVKAVTLPGLYFKTPMVQEVILYDTRLLDHDIPSTEVVTKDKRTLVVDNFAKWRITDPEKFYQRARTTSVARDRLRDIIYSELRQDFGALDLSQIVSEERANVMRQVTVRSNEKIKALDMGVEIVDVRIMRADLPQANMRSVFDRMQAERKRIANKFRSEGKEEAQKIRAGTDKEKTILLAEAYEKEQKLRGDGEASAITITARAYGKDEKFYEFLRSLEAYRNSMKDRSTMVLSSESEFLKYLR